MRAGLRDGRASDDVSRVTGGKLCRQAIRVSYDSVRGARGQVMGLRTIENGGLGRPAVEVSAWEARREETAAAVGEVMGERISGGPA